MTAIIFDLDDTLYPEREFVLSGFRSIDISGFYEIAKSKFEHGLRGTIFNETMDELGISYTNKDIGNIVETYRNHTPHIHLYEDAIGILSLLKNFQLGIITDGYAQTQRNKVRALELNYPVIYTDDYGRDKWKPSPLPYQLMSNQIIANNYIYVGDNLTKDFIAPNKLGWTTIQIIRESGIYSDIKPNPKHQPHHKINSLYQLIDIVEKL